MIPHVNTVQEQQQREEDVLTLAGSMNHRDIKVIVDTASVKNIVDINYVDKNQIKTCDDMPFIRVANSTLVKIVGSTNINVCFNNYTFSLEALVLANLPKPLLLGLEFLKAHSAVINLSNNEISLKTLDNEIVNLPLNAGKVVEKENFNVVDMKVDKNFDKELPYADGQELCQDEKNSKITLCSDVVVNKDLVKCAVNSKSVAGNDINFVPNYNFLIKNGLQINKIYRENLTLYVDILNYGRNSKKLFADTCVAFEVKDNNQIESNCVNEIEHLETLVTLPDKNVEKCYDVNIGLSKNDYQSVHNLVQEFEDIFAWSIEELGHTQLVKHRIDTTDEIPVVSRPYRVSHAERKIINNQVEEMLENGIIRKSQSPYSSPVVLVPKKDGDMRFCVNYKKLNAKTIKNVYPLPVIDDILTYLGDAKYFSSLDMFSGYWQVEIEEDHKHKTAFVTTDGLFEFNRLSFGLTTAPSTFQQLADAILGEMKWNGAMTYLDDILVYGKTLEDHNKNLKKVLLKLKATGLKLKPSKCHLAYSKITVLGHTISDQGIQPDSSKIEAVRNFATPTSKKTLQSFLGLANYYRKFIEKFSVIARPLYDLLKKDRKFVWTVKQEGAFQKLKDMLTSPPLLTHYLPEAEKELHVDASDLGIAAVLLQKTENGMHPICYVSRTLTKAEKNYGVGEKEALAVVWSLTYLRSYVWGQHIKIFSDHQPLCYLQNIKNVSGRMARWSCKLQQFDYEIIHKAGKCNQDADCLSRNPYSKATKLDEESVNEVPTFMLPLVNIQEFQEEDPVVSDLIQAVRDVKYGSSHLQRRAKNFKTIDGVLYKKSTNPTEMDKLVVPQGLKLQLMQQLHCEPLSGHLGFAKTYDKVYTRYYWDNMHRDIRKFIAGCADCQIRKGPINDKPPGGLQPIEIQDLQPFDMIGIDILGPLSKTTSQNNNIIVCTDYVTRFAITKAIPSAKAEEIATFLVEQVISIHGVPRKILSDRGQVFRSEMVRELVKNMGSESIYTTSYHPQTNGLTERFNKTLADMLSLYVSTSQNDWDKYLPLVTFAYNSSKQDSTQYAPFYLVFGRHPQLIPDAMFRKSNPEETPNPNIDEHRTKAKKNVAARQKNDKLRYDDKHKDVTYEVGDKVKLRVYIRQKGKSDKLQCKYHGPFVIVRKASPVNYVIQKGEGARAKQELVHVKRLAPYYPPYNFDD